MSEHKNVHASPAALDPDAQVPGDPVLAAKETSPEGVVVVVTMQPDRIAGGRTFGGGERRKDKPADGIRRRYRTSSWFFASDFLDRLAEISSNGCAGLEVRPVEVEVTFTLDDKAYRHVDLILDSFENAFRGL